MATKVLDVKLVAGAFASLPIDPTKLYSDSLAYIQDSYIAGLKPGVAVKFDNGYVEPAGAGELIVGYLVTDAAKDNNQNMATLSSGLISVLVGGGNQFITEAVVETDITAGTKLYVGANGHLTKTQVNDEPVVAIALSANSTASKAVLVQTI